MSQIHKPIEIPAIKIFTHAGDDNYVIVVRNDDIEQIHGLITTVPSSIFYMMSEYISQEENKNYIKQHEHEWFDNDFSSKFRKKAITDSLPIKEHLSPFIQKNFDMYISNSLWCFGL